MKGFTTLTFRFLKRAAAACIVGTLAFAGCAQEMAGVGRGGTGTMGGSIQGKELSLNGAVTTVAGGNATPATGSISFPAGAGSGTSGIGTAVGFPLWGVTTDGFNLYLTAYNTVYKISLADRTTTIVAGTAAADAWADGIGAQARFAQPKGITTDGTSLFVADGSNTIRKIAIATGEVTTLAGSPNQPGAVDGTGTDARFGALTGITTDGTHLYVSDSGNGTIRKVVIATGTVTTLAGTAGIAGGADGTGAGASFLNLQGLTTDGTNLYVADSSTVRKVVIATGVVTTLAGSGALSGSTDGIGAAASFGRIMDITSDGTNLYLTDGGGTVRKVVIATGKVSTLAGASGTGVAAPFSLPTGITTDGSSLYVIDRGDGSIRGIN